MSAFIVEDKTINKIVTWFRREIYRRESSCIDHLAKKYDIDLISDLWDEPLAKAMFALNCNAVNARYGEGEAEKFRPLDYTYRPEPYLTLIEVFKALQCWLYQCCEGDIPETSKLYQFFREIENYLARKIVSNLPEYDNAEWG